MPVRQRRSARVLLFHANSQVLLLRFAIKRGGGPFLFWAAPGAVEPGETDAEAAARELHEELGLRLTISGDVVHTTTGEFEFEGFWNQSVDVFFTASMGDQEPVLSGVDDDERNALKELRWWTADELDASSERVFPADLAAIVRRLIQ